MWMRMSVEDGMRSSRRDTHARMPFSRSWARERESAFSPVDRDGTLQPTTDTCDGFSTGPAQNGEALESNHTAKLAALLDTCACGAASSKSPSMYTTCTWREPDCISDCTVPTTMLQSQPISS